MHTVHSPHQLNGIVHVGHSLAAFPLGVPGPCYGQCLLAAMDYWDTHHVWQIWLLLNARKNFLSNNSLSYLFLSRQNTWPLFRESQEMWQASGFSINFHVGCVHHQFNEPQLHLHTEQGSCSQHCHSHWLTVTHLLFIHHLIRGLCSSTGPTQVCLVLNTCFCSTEATSVVMSSIWVMRRSQFHRYLLVMPAQTFYQLWDPGELGDLPLHLLSHGVGCGAPRWFTKLSRWLSGTLSP